MKTTMSRREKILELLETLHKANQLNNIIVKIISDVFKVNVERICKDNGITYNIIENE